MEIKKNPEFGVFIFPKFSEKNLKIEKMSHLKNQID